MTDQLPIDIHYSKLLDWLVDRKRTTRTWHGPVRDIRHKIEEAMEKLPTDCDPLVQFLQGRFVDYYSIKELVGLLVENGIYSAEKDVFGRFKSPEMRTWVEILGMYERDHVFLAECAQMLVQNTDLEGLRVKRRITKLQESMGDLTRKETETIRLAAESQKKFERRCAEFDIDPNKDGMDFLNELSRHANNAAPEVLREAIRQCTADAFGDAVEYYKKFRSVLVPKGQDRLTILCDIRSRGESAACKNWLEELNLVETETKIMWDLDEDDNPSTLEIQDIHQPTIDWNAGVELVDTQDTGQEMNPGRINDPNLIGMVEPVVQETESFRILPPESPLVEGMGTSLTPGLVKSELNDNAEPKLLWEIEVSGSDPFPSEQVISWDVDVGEDNQPIANPAICWDVGLDTVKTLDFGPLEADHLYLDVDHVRNTYLDEIYELDAFLDQRLREQCDSSKSSLLLHGEHIPANIARDISELGEMKSAISSARDALTNSTASSIILLKTSPRHLERTARNLSQLKHSSSRLHHAVDDVKVRQAQTVEELAGLSARLIQVIAQTRDMKKKMENTLSSLYDNRVVNIMGEINQL